METADVVEVGSYCLHNGEVGCMSSKEDKKVREKKTMIMKKKEAKSSQSGRAP
jgi:hypothetical protein